MEVSKDMWGDSICHVNTVGQTAAVAKQAFLQYREAVTGYLKGEHS